MVRGNYDVKVKTHPARQCLNLMTVSDGDFFFLMARESSPTSSDN